MAEALATLKPEEQQLIYLKYFQDVKIKEISELSSIPEGTVKCGGNPICHIRHVNPRVTGICKCGGVNTGHGKVRGFDSV
ncbi:sigma factor-like helix-turn-helix DNA-binding protein [Sporosarcina highlanderae]|uniref:Sigma factor-like helix-turn-helix DNA-binding protein n=1 Tax=Sporosarcina highlanderae TaxID=3035916 RepID=A0ABT8JQB2_9BACL|nr:sigma factor-like helix-turn-helix DNA-binding protein [Sporosarcina highlanderae]MDN4606602.1 sigma factor-like helix-turn-helix DNA-binding protein [Sporosarcina highlanderae]